MSRLFGVLSDARRCRVFTMVALTLMAVTACVDEVAAQDTITLNRSSRRGSRVLGRITAVRPTGVTIESGGTEREVAANEIQRINLSGEPNGLRQARSAILAGQYEQAISALEEVDVAETRSDLLKQEVEYHLLLAKAQLALRGEGDPAEAGRLMFEFLKRERDTYHFFAAVELLGDLAVAAGDFPAAARFYQQLTKAPWPEYRLRSLVLLADALLAQGDHQGASTQYAEALQQPAGDPAAIRQQNLARIGQAACGVAAGDAKAAAGELEELIAKNDPSDAELFARAYLALGHAYQKLQQPVDAVLAYLHIDLLFYRQRAAHAEALYHLTELWPQVEQPSRAVEARQLLQTRYPGTVWAKRASQ